MNPFHSLTTSTYRKILSWNQYAQKHWWNIYKEFIFSWKKTLLLNFRIDLAWRLTVWHVMEHLIITSPYLHHGQIIQIAQIHSPFDVFYFVVVHKNNRKRMTKQALNSPLLTLGTTSLISWDYITKHWKMSTSSLATIAQSIEDLLALLKNLSLGAVPIDLTWLCQTFCIMREI